MLLATASVGCGSAMQVVIGNDGTPMAVPMRFASAARPPPRRRGGAARRLPPVEGGRHREAHTYSEPRYDTGRSRRARPRHDDNAFINRMAQPKVVRHHDELAKRPAWGGGPGRASGDRNARGGGGGLQSDQYQRRRQTRNGAHASYHRGGGGGLQSDQYQRRRQTRNGAHASYHRAASGGEPDRRARIGELRQQQRAQQAQLRELREQQQHKQRELQSIHQDEMAELSRRQSFQQELTHSLEQLEVQVAQTSEDILDEINAAKHEIIELAAGSAEQLPPLGGRHGKSPVFEADDEEAQLLQRRAEVEEQAARLAVLQDEVGRIRQEVTAAAMAASAAATNGEARASVPRRGNRTRSGNQAERLPRGSNASDGARLQSRDLDDEELIRMADGEVGRRLEEEDMPTQRESDSNARVNEHGKENLRGGAAHKQLNRQTKVSLKRQKGSIIGELRKAGLAAGLPDTIHEEMEEPSPQQKDNDRHQQNAQARPPPIEIDSTLDEQSQLRRSVSWDETTISPDNVRVGSKKVPKKLTTSTRRLGSEREVARAERKKHHGEDDGVAGAEAVPGESQKAKLKRLRATAILTREYIANSMGFDDPSAGPVPAYAMALKRSKAEKEADRYAAQYGDVQATLSRSSKLRALREDKATRRRKMGLGV
eukprot:SAG31_NODE_22_length_33849_cov_13.713096_22_plen_656_part_00